MWEGDYILESNAFKKICPFKTQNKTIDEELIQSGMYDELERDHIKCAGEDCMAWRNDPDDDPQGYCKLIDK